MIKAIKGDVSGKYEMILVKLCEVHFNNFE